MSTIALIRHKTDREGKPYTELNLIEEESRRVDKQVINLYDMKRITVPDKEYDEEVLNIAMRTEKGRIAINKLKNEKSNLLIKEFVTKQKELIENKKAKEWAHHKSLGNFLDEVI